MAPGPRPLRAQLRARPGGGFEAWALPISLLTSREHEGPGGLDGEAGAGPALGTGSAPAEAAGKGFGPRREEEFASWEEKQGESIQGQETCVAVAPSGQGGTGTQPCVGGGGGWRGAGGGLPKASLTAQSVGLGHGRSSRLS